jgi:hypothetical protein
MMSLLNRSDGAVDVPERNDATGAIAAASCLESAQPTLDPVSVRFFGDWFGRPFDNGHKLRRVSAEGDRVILEFDQGETLEVVEPRGCVLNSQRLTLDQPVLTIANASRIVWSWNYYGQPPTPQTRHFIEYQRVDTEVQRSTDSVMPAHSGFPDPTFPAIAMY